MADITFNCPHCNQELAAPDDYAGEVVACPNCQAEITVPAPDQVNTMAVGEAQDPDDEDEGDEEADGLRERREDPSCPDCGADMDPEAVLCLSCGFHRRLGKRIQTDFDAS